MSGIHKFASRRMGLVGTNPVSALEGVERPRTHDEKPKRILSGDELTRLLSAVDDHYRLIFEFASETGARIGEALGVAWGDINTEAATVSFTRQLNRQRRRMPLKTDRSRRTIEITPGLAAKLRAHKMAAPQSGKHDLVFTSRAGTGHDHRNIGGRVMARAVTRAGLDAVERDGRVVEPAPTFHDLRHTHASALIADGWDIEQVSARLGHSDTSVTQRAYIHAYDAARRSDERRSRLAQLYPLGSALGASDLRSPENAPSAHSAEVANMQGNRRTR